MNTMLFTAALDDRTGLAMISSRIGLESRAEVFEADTNLFTRVSDSLHRRPLHCVLVDEAQFLNRDQVFQLAAVADRLKVPVLCYGLRTDFQANLFEGSQWLLALADEMQELKTICTCGAKATMNLRIDANGHAVREGDSVEIGGNDRYIALCRKHYMEKMYGPVAPGQPDGDAPAPSNAPGAPDK